MTCLMILLDAVGMACLVVAAWWIGPVYGMAALGISLVVFSSQIARAKTRTAHEQAIDRLRRARRGSV